MTASLNSPDNTDNEATTLQPSHPRNAAELLGLDGFDATLLPIKVESAVPLSPTTFLVLGGVTGSDAQEGQVGACRVRVEDNATTVTPLSTPPKGTIVFGSHQPVLMGDKVYIFGGVNPTGTLFVYSVDGDEWEIHDYVGTREEMAKRNEENKGGSFKRTAHIPPEYECHTAYLLPSAARRDAICCALNGYLVVIGGDDQIGNMVADISSVYTPSTNLWHQGEDGPEVSVTDCHRVCAKGSKVMNSNDEEVTLTTDTLYVYAADWGWVQCTVDEQGMTGWERVESVPTCLDADLEGYTNNNGDDDDSCADWGEEDFF
ncbi:hypothetical protein KIPB_001573 [Kipferlia bialata]|uniref:Uncharacterized protein n=1 Tax=Kipferlia bialata TaxID=797122 RepID=A0A9K3CS69_9EUKA|nr:hypothetical protein KIPB_001573 [Kipferlia bialata]|eukprot:g1573.t1